VRKIESESQFVWTQVLAILKFPFLLLLFLFRKKSLGDVMAPFVNVIRFLFEPKATVFLIGAVTCVFMYQLFFMPAQLFDRLVFKPDDIFSLNVLPVVASWFLHGSLTHFLGNMLFLFIFGRIVERRFGSFKMLLIYFGSAIISSFIAALAGQGGIGASGAIAGLVSTAILADPFYLTYFVFGIPIPVFIVGWLVIYADITGILVPVQDNIGHFAHLGGYLAIAVIVFLLSTSERSKIWKGLLLNIAMLVVLLMAYYYGFDQKALITQGNL